LYAAEPDCDGNSAWTVAATVAFGYNEIDESGDGHAAIRNGGGVSMFFRMAFRFMGIMLLILATAGSCDEANRSYEFSLDAKGGLIPIEEPEGGFSYHEWTLYIVDRNHWEGSMPAPVREGYAFVGWYDDVTNALFSLEEFVASDERTARLDARWEIGDVDVTAEYYLEGADGVYRLQETLTVLGAIGSLAIAPQRSFEHYTQNIFHPDRIPCETPVEGEDLVLRLYYERKGFALRFYADASMSTSVIIDSWWLKFGYPIVPPPDPERPGYTFDGWRAWNTDDPLEFYNGMPARDLGLWVAWSPDPVAVTVEHYREDADGVYVLFETETLSGVTGENVDAVAKEYLHYAENATHSGRIASGTSEEGESLTLRLYYARDVFTLAFVANGGSETAARTLRFGTPVEPPADPVRYGYVFAGWYGDEALTNAFAFDEMPAADTTLHAKWTPKMITIAFVTNGAAPLDPLVAQEGTSYALPSPEYAGHIFAGWFVDESLQTQHVNSGAMPSDNLTLYAKWYGQTYMIHFDTMGGDYLQDLSLPAGSPLELPSPTRTGFVFVGWYDAMLTTPFTDTVMPEGNLVLYAKWAPAP